MMPRNDDDDDDGGAALSDAGSRVRSRCASYSVFRSGRVCAAEPQDAQRHTHTTGDSSYVL